MHAIGRKVCQTQTTNAKRSFNTLGIRKNTSKRRSSVIPRGIISSDGHVCEPPNCYIDYIEPKYRDTAPRVLEQPDGTEAFVVPGMKRPVALGFIDGAGFTIKERNDRARRLKFKDIREAAYGGKARLPYMDKDGLAAEIVYASVGMGLCMHRCRIQGRVHEGLQSMAASDVQR